VPDNRDRREQLPSSVLSINDNVEPAVDPLYRKRRNPTFPKESTKLTNSNDYVKNAFHVFHQVGVLMYYRGNFKANPENAKRD